MNILNSIQPELIYIFGLLCLAILLVKLISNYVKAKNSSSNDYPKIITEQRSNDMILEDTIHNNIINSASRFYGIKNSCMTPNESRMFYYINCALDELIPHGIRKHYLIFPQVSLHSFIYINNHIEKREQDIAKNRLLAKNVDFVICHCSRQEQYNSQYYFYAYKPILVIEIDGSSHSSPKYGKEEYERQQLSDRFKDSLFCALKIPFLRYELTNDFVSKIDRVKIKELIHSKISLY